MGENAESGTSENPRLVICIGDIHGYFSKLQNLWANLQSAVPPLSFESAIVIFLGDYCDRGPDTRAVLNFLISLPTRYPHQSHVFLCGNHDFAFAAFVGVLPPPPDGSPFSATWEEYLVNEEREGWFKGDGYEQMHVQGRRWGGKIKVRYNEKKKTEYRGSIYDAGPTFESYGVPHGSAELSKAVPEEHKKFLASLVWVHEEENVWIDTSEGRHCCKLIAVHAGLARGKGVDDQLKLLKARDTSLPKVEALSGRHNVWEIPEVICSPVYCFRTFSDSEYVVLAFLQVVKIFLLELDVSFAYMHFCELPRVRLGHQNYALCRSHKPRLIIRGQVCSSIGVC